MTRFQLCRWLSRELRGIHPIDLARATRLIVQLSAACKAPEDILARFAEADFDKTPVAPAIDPELWPERPVGADWSIDEDEYTFIAASDRANALAEAE